MSRESEAQFRAYFDNFPECLFVVDVGAEGEFLFCAYNPTAERSFGRLSADVAGQSPEAVMPALAAAAARAAFAHCVASGAVYRYTRHLDLPAGPKSFDVVLTPLRDEDERITRILGAALDVTERNRLESRLHQAQKLEAIGQLTGGIAHDFNNLLQVVTGGLALLERNAGDTRRRGELIEAIRRAAQRGGELTRRLLTVARRQALRPEALDLRHWLEVGVRELLERTLRGDVQVRSEVAAGLPAAMIDPAELELALLNLAVNARDAMPNGGTLTISAVTVSLAGQADRDGLRGDFIRLSVSDTGLGMSPEIQARVFEPFFTTKGVGEGTGLGLAQVYGFAQQSGGGVRLVSAPGAGTTVSLLLPCSAGPAAATPAQEAPAPRAGLPARTILVVEDDDEVAALVVDMLSQLGYAPTRVSSAGAALGALADGRQVDLMFSDIIMPGGMNGLGLAAEAGRRRPGLPVVLTTGYSGGGALPEEGERTVLRKPYRIEDLAEALESALQRRG